MRIIGGQWRGRVLNFALVEGLRPTGSRIRETLFNWLMPILPGSRCLDVFAGSGALGFEALSRGAASCLLVEKNATAIKQLNQSINLLGTANARAIQADALAYLQHPPAELMDVVFLDPPFVLGVWDEAIRLLEQHWLADVAYVYIEAPKGHCITAPTHWHLHRQKDAGQVTYRLYVREMQ